MPARLSSITPPPVRLLALLAGAALLAGCETPVSLQERRPLPRPAVVVLPAPAPAPLPFPAPPPPDPGAPPPVAQALPVPTSPGAAQPPAPPQAGGGEIENVLITEQHWLQSWFRGSPVVVGLHGDGAVRVEVPLDYCFDAGQAPVKPALAAVLDRVATSTRRIKGRLAVETPADADAANASRLALDRATSVRQHLSARGVEPTRISEVPLARGSAVVLRLYGPQP